MSRCVHAEEPKNGRLPTREEVHARARPLPPYEEMIIEGLAAEILGER
ncbi:MAG: hypothetical protein ACRD07_18780 [Acidimicrobiales bacterium]